MWLRVVFRRQIRQASISNDVVSVSLSKPVQSKRKPLPANLMSRVGRILEQCTLFGWRKYSYGREDQRMDTDATVHTTLQ